MGGPSTSTSSATRLGRYQLLEPLGEGGMAKVFIALKDGADEVCVLKQLHIQLEQQDEAVVRFLREAHIASLLDHPNIARITDAGVEGSKFCIAMEFIAGQTVEAMVRAARKQGGVLPFEVTLPIILSALDGLHYAHELVGPEGKPLKLVHRDLSPRNVMLSYSGETKLIDFGIAKGEVDEYKTAVGALMGTPYYMSPEQARAVDVDRRSDIYTLGVLLFEMLSGRRLVQAKGRAKILMTVAREDAPPVTKLNPAVPGALEAVLFRALEKKPENRYPTALAFADAIRGAVSELTTTPPDQLGMFVRELFPDGEEKARALFALGAKDGAAPFEATRIAVTDDAGALVVPTELPASGPSGDRTRTGYVDPDALVVDYAPDASGRTSEPTAANYSQAFSSQTFAESPESLASRSALTGHTKTSAVQKIGVGFTVMLLCIVGYVAYGHLTAPTEVRPQSATTPIEAPSVLAAPRTDPRVRASTAEVEPRRAPPPPVEAAPPPPRAPVRTAPAKTRVARRPEKPAEPETPELVAPPPAASKLQQLLASVKRTRAKRDAIALNDRVQRAVDRLPDGRQKDAAQRELDRLTMTNEVGVMIDALDGAIRIIER